MVGSGIVAKNINLGWKLMAMVDTLAFSDMATITAVKSFIVQAHVGF